MSQSLAEQVYEMVKQDILTCELQPGTMIAQPKLAERYGVGITPLREALQKLAKEGLVQSIPRFGYVVAPITLADVQEVFELRLVLEKAVARLAAQRVTPEQLVELERMAATTYVYQEPQSYSNFLDNNTRFHLAVAEASGNRRMLESISVVLDALTRVFHLGLDLRDSADEMRREHQDLVAALAQHDPDLAEKIVIEQITQSRTRVLEALLSRIGSQGTDLPGQSIQLGGARKPN